MNDSGNFRPDIDFRLVKQLADEADDAGAYDLLTEPLRVALYRRQDFAFINELSVIQRLLIAYDYVQMQVFQGGFIQFIQNRYVPLLLPVHEGLLHMGAMEMAQLIDDVLKVYVLNQEALDKDTTSEAFARLYAEFGELEALDQMFAAQHPDTLHQMVQYALQHFDEVAMDAQPPTK
jgi:hypothetical protein